MRIGFTAAVAASIAGAVAMTACSASSAGQQGTVDVVGFSVLKTSNEKVIDEFTKTGDGRGVGFRTSYGASGDQSRAVAGGQEADYVHLSLETDVTRLVEAGKVADDWKSGPTEGVLTSSVVVFAVRPGNPEGIDGWEDLVRPGVEVITPNPASSGSARWNILAAWGQAVAQGGDPEAAEDYVSKLLGNTISLPGSAREATSAFVDGKQGDVLLSYENEAILARQQGQELDYVVPPQTLLIENSAALVKGAGDPARQFFDFLHSEEAQRVYAESGFRPVGMQLDDLEVEGANDPAAPFPTPRALLTIDEDFGGWAEAKDRFFDEEQGIITRLLAAAGQEAS